LSIIPTVSVVKLTTVELRGKSWVDNIGLDCFPYCFSFSGLRSIGYVVVFMANQGIDSKFNSVCYQVDRGENTGISRMCVLRILRGSPFPVLLQVFGGVGFQIHGKIQVNRCILPRWAR
jgi:hypothetical protein